jgi:hypothetical protein
MGVLTQLQEKVIGRQSKGGSAGGGDSDSTGTYVVDGDVFYDASEVLPCQLHAIVLW